MDLMDVRELVGDDPIVAEIVAGFIELDDDGQKLILDLIELIKRCRKSDTP